MPAGENHPANAWIEFESISSNKSLMVALVTADCALMNLGCSLWDTCATEAIVVAAGGKVTHLTGQTKQLTILSNQVTSLLGWKTTHVARDASRKESYRNKYGVLVTGRRFEEKAGISHQQFVREHLVPQPELVALLQDAGPHQPTDQL